MKPYDPKSTCPKCGAVGVETMYHSGKESCYCEADWSGGREYPTRIDHEHLQRNCPRCRYHWPEAVLSKYEVQGGKT